MKRICILLSLLCLFGCKGKQSEKEAYSWEGDLKERIALDFNKSRDEVKKQIQKYIPDVTDAQIDAWTADGKLESMEIDGKRVYFSKAAANLFRVDPWCKAKKEAVEPHKLEKKEVSSMTQLPQIIASGDGLLIPQRFRIKFTLTVKADAVPEGETIRCWLPYPRNDVPRQTDVKFLSSSGPHKLSDTSCKHSSLYMEQKAKKGEPTVFSEEFEFTQNSVHNSDIEHKLKPYDKSTALYREYTAERPPHMVFSERIKALADSLTQGIDNPYLQAKAMFGWISKNFPWAGAREYSTIGNIPEYVLDIRHGDCGQVTLLLLTMCRYKGIPAHFQSGFQLWPEEWNLHDWGELYFEGIGWVPVDQSYGIPDYVDSKFLSEHPGYEYFYLGSMDHWRFIVNQDWGMELDPKKKYPRSDTVDFQKGEVEWEGGNLYYPMWDYHMDIEYL